MSNLCCLKCNGSNFTAKVLRIYHEGKKVKSVAWFCDNCNHPMMDSNQMQETLDDIHKAKEIPTEEPKKELTYKQKKVYRPNKMHPWKRQAFKKSIDKHVLEK